MNTRYMAASLAAATAVVSVIPGMNAQASTNFDLRRKVVGAAGIMNIMNIDGEVTRGEFADMLVNASTFGSTASGVSAISVFADVPKDHAYASSIRTAVEQGWMTGYLGGMFKPDQVITLQEAIKGILALLGYTNSDFTGDQIGARYAKYQFLDLDECMDTKTSSDLLNKDDCINLFYNLLKSETKDGQSPYGKILGCELTADGEINPITLTDNVLKGPKVIRRNHSLEEYIPFKLDSANCFLNGDGITLDHFRTVVKNSDYVVVYYHTGTKTIWAYDSNGGSGNSRGAVHGTIQNIYYSSSDVMTPSAVQLADSNIGGSDEYVDSGIKYQLKDTDMQFAFSVYGDMRVGDEVTLVYEVSGTDSDGEPIYTVIDYLED